MCLPSHYHKVMSCHTLKLTAATIWMQSRRTLLLKSPVCWLSPQQDHYVKHYTILTNRVFIYTAVVQALPSRAGLAGLEPQACGKY